MPPRSQRSRAGRSRTAGRQPRWSPRASATGRSTVLEGALAPTGNSPDMADGPRRRCTRRRAGSDDAIAVYEGMLERDPNNLVAANNLAMLLANNRTDAASLERAEKLTEQFAKTDNPAFLDTYGWVLYKRGRYAEAVAVLEKAVAQRAAGAGVPVSPGHGATQGWQDGRCAQEPRGRGSGYPQLPRRRGGARDAGQAVGSDDECHTFVGQYVAICASVIGL